MMDGWLEGTRALQAHFHPESERTPGTEGWRHYVEYNSLAVVTELGEFLREVEVRPWKSPTGLVLDRTAAVNELVDVGHFHANLLIALNVDDVEYEYRYRRKVRENFRRLESGVSVPTTEPF